MFSIYGLDAGIQVLLASNSWIIGITYMIHRVHDPCYELQQLHTGCWIKAIC